MIDNESKCFRSLGRKLYKGTPSLSESMSCILSRVHWLWSCLYFVTLVQLRTSVAVVAGVLGIRTRHDRKLQQLEMFTDMEDVSDKYNNEQKEFSHESSF